MTVALARPEQATATATLATTILIVRHTEVHNPDRLFYGRLPEFRLSTNGEQQADQLARRLADLPVKAIYSSPLLRARQTAERLAAQHPEATCHCTELLIELGSSWQGTPYQQLQAGFSAYEHRREPEDETIEQIAARMTAFVAQARLQHPGETVVGISHGDPITILRLALEGKPLTVASLRSAPFVALGSVTSITYQPDTPQPVITTVRP